MHAVVCIHGGGWRKGSKINHRKVAQYLASQGFVTASISYRLSGEARFSAQFQDCKAAVRFLRAHAGKYGIDADKIGVIGHSAGGHLAALLATSSGMTALEGDGGHAEFSSAVQAAVPMGAQTDFLSVRNREISGDPERGQIWRQFLGGSQSSARDIYQLASPLAYVGKDDPPCWLITGEKDDASTRADKMRIRMNELDIEANLTVIAGAPHPFLVQQNWFDEAMQTAAQFFKRELKGDAAN